MTNDASDEEIRAAITDEHRAALPEAIRGWQIEARSAFGDAEAVAELFGELGKYIRLTGTSMGHDERTEWIEGAAEELEGFPISLVLPELRAARRREPWPNKLIAGICERIEPKAVRLVEEGERLRRLEELANE
jgi:hypothetical protein